MRTIFLIIVWELLAPTVNAAPPAEVREVVTKYCVGCHDAATTNGLDLAPALTANIDQRSADWEKAVRRLRARQMPPAGEERPSETTYQTIVRLLETDLDAAAEKRPTPGRPATIRRLNRNEYQNAIRDLLDLHVTASTWLPAEEASHGFDNVTVGELSPTLLDRYITAALHISRLAVGGARQSPGGDTFRVPADLTQEDRVEGLPIGTRGGVLIKYQFPQTGAYDVQIRLARDRNEHVEGLNGPHELQVLLDRRVVQSFTVKPAAGNKDHSKVDEHLRLRLTADAGPHDLGVTFAKQSPSLPETLRQPYQSHFNMHRHPRLSPAVFQVSITGPFDPTGPGDTPTRRRLFGADTGAPIDRERRATEIVGRLLRSAWRRPIQAADIERIMPFFRQAHADAGFEAGIESALAAILVSREFLLRVEHSPADLPANTPHPISDVELASRLSFLLWSSIPDAELLEAAERNELHRPDVLQRQTRRLVLDPKAASLITNFAAQWLHLRNLDSITPDSRLYPDFDDNLRQAMRRETELLLDEIRREDRSVLTLLRSEHAWLNERLAKHYGIPHVYGPHFRRVDLPTDSDRGGLLRQASILTVTSYATRTSPTLRGKWILENLLGTPPPPPLPNVPTLEDNTVAANLPVRERLAKHRSQAACASCHNLIDPIGFSLENYDAVGRWRTMEEGKPVDASAGMPDGRQFVGVAGLEQGLLDRPELFVGALAEKLLTFALGRGIEPDDGPALRQIVRMSAVREHRFSTLMEAIVQSQPMLMRTSP